MTTDDTQILVSWLKANGFAYMGTCDTPCWESGALRVAMLDGRILLYAFDKILPDNRAQNLWGATFTSAAPLKAITCSIDAAANAALTEMMPS
jgi:hypothetical protein